MIKLYSINNLRREEVGEIDLQALLPTEDLVEKLFQQFEKAGVNVDREKGGLWIKLIFTLLKKGICIFLISMLKYQGRAKYASILKICVL